jgi:hypothetical protein
VKKEGESNESDECPVKDIKVAIFDEMSVIYNQLFGVAIYILMKCSKLEVIVMAGDHRQLSFIKKGNLIRDIMRRISHCYIEFLHCHHINENSRVLVSNATHVNNRDFDKVDFSTNMCQLISNGDGSYEKTKKVTERALKQLSCSEYKQQVITRTNEMKKHLNSVVDEYYALDIKMTKSIYKRRKFSFKKNVIHLNIIYNELLVLLDIWDCQEDVYTAVKLRKDQLLSLAEGNVSTNARFCTD